MVAALWAVMVRVATYTAQSLVQAGRSQDISSSLAKVGIDIIVIQGIRLRQTLVALEHRGGTCKFWNWGYSRDSLTNKAARVQMRFAPKFCHKVLQAYSPPASIGGRAGAIKVNACKNDLMIINLYVPQNNEFSPSGRVHIDSRCPHLL